MSNIKSFNNRLKRLDSYIPNKKSDPVYYIYHNHINLSTSDKCILCSENINSKYCSNKLDDIGLHIFMDEHEEWFVLFLDEYFDKSIEKTEYTGFISHPETVDDYTILIYNKDMYVSQ